MNAEEIYKSRLAREKTARKEAERLLEEKSLELFNANKKLEKLNTQLEEQVKNRTEALKEAKDDLEMIAYIASHDLKTPIRSISHISNWIDEDLAANEYSELPNYANLLRSRTLRIETLLNSLIEYTNLNQVSTNSQTVNSKALVSAILTNEFEAQSFSFELTGEFPTLKTSEKLLHKVFRNLISNGLRHNHSKQKHLTIHAEVQTEFVLFTVSDNGIGIDPKYEHKVFELFQTLERKDESETSGVGLPIVKKIVNSQGGDIYFKSEINKGSTFYFTWRNH